MRYIFLFLSILFFDSVYSQDYLVNESFTNVPLKKAIREIEKKYGIHFSYSTVILENVIIDAEIQESPIEEAMDILLLGTGISYRVVKRKYIVLNQIKDGDRGSSQELCGELIDSASGMPLPYANVHLKNAGLGATSDRNGRFIINGSYEKNDFIQVMYLGFRPINIPVQLLLDAPCTSLSMTKAANLIDEVVVTEYLTDGVDMAESYPYLRIEPKKLGILPGLAEPDILQTMQMLPGISNPDGRASSLHIRGGTPDQNLILWDNIPIYYGGHFFGMVSPFNPYLVQDMKVYRSGFDAKYEGRVSGTINITSINEIPDSINGGIGVNLTHADAYLSIPFKKINTALILGARKSYFNQWKSPYFNSISNLVFQDTKVGYSSNDTNVIVHQFNTDYHDYKAKLIVDVSNKDKAFISFFTAKNKMTYSFTDTLNNIYSIDDFELVNQGASASWERKWNTRLKTNLDLTYSDYKYSSYDTLTVSDADTTIIWLNNDNSNNMTDIQLRFSNAIQLAPGHRLEVGGQFNTRELLNKYLENYAFEPSFYGSISNYATTTSFFGDYTYSLKNRLLLRPGFRYTYHKELNKHYYEPRIYGQYKAFSNVAIKASAGIYHQDISQLVDVGFNQLGVGNELWVLADGKEIESIDSKQVMVGANFNKNGWWLDAEGYYKTIAGITTFSKSLSNIANRPFEYGDATVIGLDLFVKKRWNNYRAWVSYTLSKTDYLFESVSTESFPAPHDQTHSMRLGQLYKWKQIEVSLAWQFSSGRPYHITDSVGAEYFADIQDSGYFLVWQPNNIGRLPAFHQLDLSVLYNFPNKRRKRWNAKIGFSLKNIYNRRNTLSRRYLLYYDANDLGPSEYYGFQIYSYDLFHQGILPNLLLRFEW